MATSSLYPRASGEVLTCLGDVNETHDVRKMLCRPTVTQRTSLPSCIKSSSTHNERTLNLALDDDAARNQEKPRRRVLYGVLRTLTIKQAKRISQ
ncbi:hypothetical protein RB195_023318 [Necator americanus]|uniref:Uncharacterized protein n=1 Tax=Necator americanus TaxID=51031 RepID=A0ABR1EIN2_NECAM